MEERVKSGIETYRKGYGYISLKDANGKAKFKGFFGEYDVEIIVNGKVISKKINLTAKGKREFNFDIEV